MPECGCRVEWYAITTLPEPGQEKSVDSKPRIVLCNHHGSADRYRETLVWIKTHMDAEPKRYDDLITATYEMIHAALDPPEGKDA